MSYFLEAYQAQTGIDPGPDAGKLDPLFEKIKAKELLPPRGQQAVDCGFIAHTFNDSTVNPSIYKYYQWVLGDLLADTPPHELPANIIGDECLCTNIFATNWPQPLTVNRWQADDVLKLPLINNRAVIIENNGVFIWLHHLQPAWPLILQSGNNFNPVYKKVIRDLAQRIKLTYLGDLDTAGIRLVDRLATIIQQSGGDFNHLAALQSPGQIASWVAGYGILDPDGQRIHTDGTIRQPVWQQEANFLEIGHKFVEQE